MFMDKQAAALLSGMGGAIAALAAERAPVPQGPVNRAQRRAAARAQRRAEGKARARRARSRA